MGYLLVDNRESGGVLEEYNTSTCVHCHAQIIYASKPIGNFLRKVRTSIRADGKRVEEIGQGYFCTKCNGDICNFCGEAASRSIGPCPSMGRIAATLLG